MPGVCNAERTHASFYHSCSQILNNHTNKKEAQGKQGSNSAEHFKSTASEFPVGILTFYLNFLFRSTSLQPFKEVYMQKVKHWARKQFLCFQLFWPGQVLNVTSVSHANKSSRQKRVALSVSRYVCFILV